MILEGNSSCPFLKGYCRGSQKLSAVYPQIDDRKLFLPLEGRQNAAFTPGSQVT